MMDANHISERLSSLKNEMSELRVTNAVCCNRRGYTAREVCICVTTSSLGGDQAGISGSNETLYIGGQASGGVLVSGEVRSEKPREG